MELSPNTLLATGGIAAVIAAGWHQIKTIATYLSSFVVVRATMDSAIGNPVRVYLKQEWKLFPSGLLYYVSRYFPFRDRANQLTVPFRIAADNSIFYKNWKVIIFSTKNNLTTLISLRGLIDFDELIKVSLHLGEKRFEDSSNEISRFQILKIIGEEKSFQKTQYKNSPSVGSSLGGNPPEASVSYSNETLDLCVDESFMYEKSQYIYDQSIDPFEALYFPDEIIKYVKQAQQWLDMGKWYTERSIPWRRGWLLHGPGGTGKSSLAKAVAQKLRIPVYQYFLATLSDQEFMHEWLSMSMPCMVLFEDFDTVFDGRTPLTEHKSLSFDCILNQISGVDSTSGIFLIVTTNHLNKIDPALGVEYGNNGISTRPGRIDTVIHVGAMLREHRLLLAQRILKDWPDEIVSLVDCDAAKEIMPVQFQEMCLQKAFHLLNEQLTP